MEFSLILNWNFLNSGGAITTALIKNRLILAYSKMAKIGRRFRYNDDGRILDHEFLIFEVESF
jgi:hypothetical protein